MSLTWHPDRLKEKLLADLVANGELVGKFLEGEARRRLLAYPELDTIVDGKRYVGGGAYRRYVAGLIGSDATRERNAVLIRVGVGLGKGGRHHGLYIELGSKTSPARPFLRPAVFENADKIIQVLTNR